MKSLLILTLFVAAVIGQQNTGNLRVVITEIPMDMSRSPTQTNSINWDVPTGKEPYYCVGSVGITAMRFTCPQCNSTLIDQALGKATQNLFAQFGYPAIVIKNMPVSKFLNGKQLVCEGTENTGSIQGPTAMATINIRYLDKPTVVNKDGDGPAKAIAGGNRFYLQSGSGSMILRCNTSGNPTPTSFQWKIDGQVVSRSKDFTVDQQRILSSVICAVNNGLQQYPVDSDAVKIAPWDIPKLYGTNFQNVQRNQPSSFTNGKVQVGKTVKLTCQVTGNPQPFVRWMQQNQVNSIVNASCNQVDNRVLKPPGRQYTPPNQQGRPTPATNIALSSYLVQSSCDLLVSNYSFVGQFWCSACNSVAANKDHCVPSLNTPASSNVKIQVIGPPLMADDLPTAVQPDPNKPARVSVYYCASPPPNVPRDLYWQIGGETVRVGDKGRYQPQTPRPNGTYCFTEELVISPYTKEDEGKTYILKMANTYGNLEIPVDVQALLNGGNQITNSGHNVGLAVGLAIGFFVLMVIIVVAILWWRSLACFAGKKAPDERYQSNVAPEHVRSEPSSMVPYTQPPHNGYNPPPSEKNDGFIGSIRPSDREGMGFAEMDLTPNTRPPLPPTQDYRDYHSPPPAYGLKSATNSVV